MTSGRADHQIDNQQSHLSHKQQQPHPSRRYDIVMPCSGVFENGSLTLDDYAPRSRHTWLPSPTHLLGSAHVHSDERGPVAGGSAATCSS